MPHRIFGWIPRWRFAIAAAALVLLAAALRVSLVRLGWPGTDSDEAITGLMARHILLRGEHPIFFYGQAYMGSIEAHTAALSFAVFGISLAALKYAVIALYLAFMVVMYFLLARAFDRWWALFGLLLLSFGADDVLLHQLMAIGGYQETLLFGASMTVFAARLAGTDCEATPRRARLVDLAGWGLSAGLGLWSDPLVLPFVGVSALVLALACWDDMRRPIWGMALVCLLIGISPWIVYSVTASTPAAAASFLQSTPQATTTAAAPPSLMAVLRDRVLGAVVISVPNTTGAIPLCPLTQAAWPPAHWTAPAVQRCVAVRAAWGSGFLVLLTLAAALEARCFLAARRALLTKHLEARRAVGRSAARLMALAAPGATIVLYAVSPAAADTPWAHTRYIITTLIALPVLLATLWDHTRPFSRAAYSSLSGVRAPLLRLAVAGLVGGLTGVFALGTFTTYAEVPQQQTQDRVQADLAQRLREEGVTGIYAPYWACYQATFLSGETAVCAPIRGNEFAVWNPRYLPYVASVRSASRIAYVLPLPSDYARTFPAWAASHGLRVDTTTVDGKYVIFRVLSASG